MGNIQFPGGFCLWPMWFQFGQGNGGVTLFFCRILILCPWGLSENNGIEKWKEKEILLRSMERKPPLCKWRAIEQQWRCSTLSNWVGVKLGHGGKSYPELWFWQIGTKSNQTIRRKVGKSGDKHMFARLMRYEIILPNMEPRLVDFISETNENSRSWEFSRELGRPSVK